MNYYRKILIVLAMFLLAGCAQETTIGYEVYEQKALDEWVAKYAPNAIPMGNGGYYEVQVESQDGAEKVTGDKWLVLSYIIKDLEGNIVYTRSEAMARQQATFTKYTHYVPDYAYLMPEKNNTMIQGQYLNLLEMSVGEVRKLYLPSKLGYGSSVLSNSVGYGGQYSLAANKPLIVDSLRVIEIINDAEQRDYDKVDSVALAWGMTPADTVVNHYYIKKLYSINHKDSIIGKDSTARIYYTGRFLDGFVFDTNIDSIRRRVYGEIREESDTAAIIFKGADAKNIPAAIFEPASRVDSLRENYLNYTLSYGDTIRMVVSSFYAYGIGGRTGYSVETSSSVYIPPYLGGYGYGGYGYGGYGYGYDSYYYGSGYYGGYYDYQNTSSSVLLRTEVQPYTPLIYDFVVMKRK